MNPLRFLRRPVRALPTAGRPRVRPSAFDIPWLVVAAASLAAVPLAGCSEAGSSTDDDCLAGDCAAGAGGSDSGEGTGGTSVEEGGGGAGEGGGAKGEGSGGSPSVDEPVAVSCTSVVERPDLTGAEVVGDGSAASCTEAALRQAVLDGGTVRFDCGVDPVTITLTETIDLPEDVDLVLDGGGLVTLDGGGSVRHFHYEDPDWMNSTTQLVFMGLIFRNGHAPLLDYREPIEGYPECAYGYGSESGGGAIWVRNVNLKVVECEFYDNEAALVGPDVGGGAIYAVGVPTVAVSGSRFVGNSAANGGAIAMLFANPIIENTVFEDNTAVGFGQNRKVSAEECPSEFAFGHDNQAGHGGLAGGVYFDGLNDEDHTVLLCGVTFTNNRANELAGAFFRTPNAGRRNLLIDRSSFLENTARLGGATFIKDNSVTVVASTFAHNRAGQLADGETVGGALGGLWVNSGDLDIENSTFFDNAPSGLNLEGGTGAVRSSTIVKSDVDGILTIDATVLFDVECGQAANGDDNLQWPAAGSCLDDATESEPLLGELGDHGGPTPTFLPAPASPALGLVSSCPSIDQRGEVRPASGCAAGSVEP